jgi:hypothetical protein
MIIFPFQISGLILFLKFSFLVSMAMCFFGGEISQNCKKKKKGPLKGLCNFRVVICIYWPDFNRHSNREAILMMDGLDFSSPKSDGHDYLVVTLLAKCKTCLHLTQAPNCLLPLLFQRAKVSSPLEVTVEHEVQVSASKS